MMKRHCTSYLTRATFLFTVACVLMIVGVCLLSPEKPMLADPNIQPASIDSKIRTSDTSEESLSEREHVDEVTKTNQGKGAVSTSTASDISKTKMNYDSKTSTTSVNYNNNTYSIDRTTPDSSSGNVNNTNNSIDRTTPQSSSGNESSDIVKYIYEEGKYYDHHGLFKDANYNKRKQSNGNKFIFEYITPSLNNTINVTSILQSVLASDIRNNTYTTGTTSPTTPLHEGRDAIFINCGGTFPWSVELFLSTYNEFKQLHMHTFIPNPSYSILYRHFVNHTLHIAEASYTNKTSNVDMVPFGIGYTVTTSLKRIDLASWLMHNARKEDYVIVRMESEDELNVLERLKTSGAISIIDKYYTSSSDSGSLKTIRALFKETPDKFHSWDNEGQDYSDILKMNNHFIPVPGQMKTNCNDTNDKEKFALFLYSKKNTPNVNKVIQLLHTFSPNNKIPATIFLPYTGFKLFEENKLNVFSVSNVGVYFENRSKDTHSLGKINESVQMRNEAIAASKVSRRHGAFLGSVLVGGEVSAEAITGLVLDYNYNVFVRGVDITHLIADVVAGESVTADKMQRQDGEYVKIDIDHQYSEYLVLYVVKKFTPWLLDIHKCFN